MAYFSYAPDAPIKHTCPDINAAQKTLDEAADKLTDLIGSFREMNEHIKDKHLSDIQESIDKVYEVRDNALEDLRKANDTLRTWGTDLGKTCKEMEREIDRLEDEVSDLETEIETLKDEHRYELNELKQRIAELEKEQELIHA